jgi:hypothetical protein
VSVGHVKARFDDLILDFRNDEHRADSSVIWLRNGGGKSSILNLFFSLVRPKRREFLGGDGDRRLEDYVLENDRSVVVAEWELEGSAASPNTTASPVRYLTGAFHERVSGSRVDSTTLRSLFFSTRVIPDDPQLTLEGLPIYVERNGSRYKRQLIGFKQEWQDLGRRYPHADARETEQQWEWAEILERARIHHELFGYQLRMNQREGGAYDLFRFQDSDEFVDFFLALVLESETNDSLAKTIDKFRERLKYRADCLLPQLTLAQGLIERLGPLARIRENRERIHQSVMRAGAELQRLAIHLGQRVQDLRAKALEESERETRAQEDAVSARTNARQRRRRAASLRLLAARERMRQLDEQIQQLEIQLQEATRECAIWDAALPLKDALAYAEEAENCRKELERKLDEQAPLLANLKVSAVAFASALRAAIKQLRKEEREHLSKEEAARQQATAARDSAVQQNNVATRLDQKAADLIRDLEKAAHSRFRLEGLGAFHQGESPKAATERLIAQIAANDDDLMGLEPEIQQLRDDLTDLQQETRAVAQDEFEADRTSAKIQESLEVALSERHELEQEPMLLRCLEVESLSIETLDDTVEIRLRESARAMQERVADIRAHLAEDQRAIIHLKEANLLPPERDVEQIREVLRSRAIRAWSGWEYISTNVPPAEFRDFIARAPEIARGVVVADADFERAELLSLSGDLNTDLPIAVSSQSATNRETAPQQIVVGPTSDAYFDPMAGKRELMERELRGERQTALLAEIASALNHLQTIQVNLQAFRMRYPRGWFDNQTAALQSTVERKRACERRLAGFAAEAVKITENIALREQDCERLKVERAAAQSHLARVEEYIEMHGDNPLPREQELQRVRADAASAREQAERLFARALSDEGRAQEANRKAKPVGESARVCEDELGRIKYIEDVLPTSEPGEIEVLRNNYHRLDALYQKQIGSEALSAQYESAKNNEQKARQRFADELRGGKFAGKLKNEIDETTVRAALVTIQSSGDINQRRGESDAVRERNIIALSSIQERRDHTAGQCRQLERDCANQGGLLELGQNEALPEDAESVAAIAERAAEELENRATELEKEAKEAERRKEDARRQTEKIVASQDILETLRPIRDRILAAALSELRAAIEWVAPRDNEIGVRVSQLREQLQHADQEEAGISKEREAAIRAVHSWIDDSRFEGVKIDFARKLKALEADEFEREVGVHCEDLKLRVKTTKDEIAEDDKHRLILINSLLGEAENGIQLLKSAAARSKIPGGLKALAGHNFLRISTREPVDAGERQARIGELLDEVVRIGTVPKGIQLIQQAVRRLSNPIEVRVLFPDLDGVPRYMPITDMAALSGGERLTCAVLLYCTLAQLRASRHGTGLQSYGVLFLDNPIGTSSRPKLLALQREVARAMGVQLIYTAGGEDLEAIRMLPVLVRLRNGKYDRGTGHQIVELAPENSAVGAARLVRPNDPPEPSADQQAATTIPE